MQVFYNPQNIGLPTRLEFTVQDETVLLVAGENQINDLLVEALKIAAHGPMSPLGKALIFESAPAVVDSGDSDQDTVDGSTVAIADLHAEEAIAVIQGIDQVEWLQALKAQETGGKTRKTVLAAIADRIADLQDAEEKQDSETA